MTPFCSYAWRMLGYSGSQAGTLAFDGQHFAFFTDRAEDDIFFDRSTMTDLKFPWYYFGGGFKVKVGGRALRFSIIAPNTAEFPGEVALEKLHRFMGAGAQTAGTSIKRGAGRVLSAMSGSISEGRANMRGWRSLLETRP
ncbi:MAG: hypothetical protein KF799_00485 [Bdellovibrionales bacterium]|nr:hypothetical protein [Bdellovibrionales bacterium]